MEYSAGTDSKEILLQPRNGIESNDLRSTQTIWGNGLTLSSIKRIELDEEETTLRTCHEIGDKIAKVTFKNVKYIQTV